MKLSVLVFSPIGQEVEDHEEENVGQDENEDQLDHLADGVIGDRLGLVQEVHLGDRA